MRKLHIEPAQPDRHLRHALRPALSQRTIPVRSFPFIPLHRNAMPQQYTIHYPSSLVGFGKIKFIHKPLLKSVRSASERFENDAGGLFQHPAEKPSRIMRVRLRQQSNSNKALVDHVENMLLQFIPKRRETLIVKIAIDRTRQPAPPGLCSLPRTISGGSPMHKDGADFMFEKTHMHFFIFKNRG